MIDKLTTEIRNPSTTNMDEWTSYEILKQMNQEDASVATVINQELNQINEAVKLIIQAFQNKGRLFYIGAGTSGRLGILDAVECVPTFSTPQEKVQGIIAGGLKAFTEAVEGAEDAKEGGVNDLKQVNLKDKDIVVGIAASGRTPYVIGALAYANEVGAKTVSIACNKQAMISKYADVPIELQTGPEILTGSTRLKAGTAQKLVLNMLSTTAMIGIGKTYQNLMVDVYPTNHKLIERSKHIIMDATDVDYATAETYYQSADKNVKIAIIMILMNCSQTEAKEKIKQSRGFIKQAIINK